MDITVCSVIKFLKPSRRIVTIFYNLRFQHSAVQTKKSFNPLQRVTRHREECYEPQVAKRICVSVLGNGAVGQPRCLCVFTELKCYMFNCGEGSTRIAKDHKVELRNARHIFITEAKWENLAGISDIYLTRTSFGLQKITLHGPPNIENFSDVLKVNKKTLIICKKDIEDSPYCDDTVEIESVPVYKMKVRKQKSIHLQRNQGVQEKEVYRVVCYIFQVKSRPGDFSPEKCVELGVPVGPCLLKLKNGDDITLPSGKMVRSEDVHYDTQKGSTFLVVDCPYEELIETFVNEKKLHKFESTAVFHFSPPHVIESYAYQKWMQKFPTSTLHVILNSCNSPFSSEAIHEFQYVLHMLHPKIFPLLYEKHVTPLDTPKANILQADSRLQLHLRPQEALDRSNVVKFNSASVIQQVHEIPGFSESLAQLHQAISVEEANIIKNGKFLDDYPEVIFLGTSSSSSIAYRNVSAILIRINNDSSILLDCGEGTYMQLVRYFGPDKIQSELCKISCIFISHHHSDHYVGLFTLVQARKDAFISSRFQYQPVSVVTSTIVASTIKEFSRIFQPIFRDIRLYLSNKLLENCCFADPLKAFSVPVEVQPVPVVHCTESYGVVLHGSNWKIVYSGDAAPSKALIDEGQNCNLLIHEASMEDKLLLEAIQKKHSTPCQVIEVAEKMNAEHIIMTHFSKRYSAMPVFAESRDIGCAFDFMTVRLRDLPLLPLFVPTLKILFADILHKCAEKSASVGNFEKLFSQKLPSERSES